MQFGFIIPSGPDKNGKKATHPQEWERAGATIMWTKPTPKNPKRKPYIHFYPTTPTKEAEELVAWHTRLAIRGEVREPTSEPLEIVTCYFFTRSPAQEKAKIMLPFPTITPDVDNLVKLVLDGMTKVLYIDDCKVIQESSFKRYTHHDAHTFVGVRSLEDNEAMPPWDVYPHLAWCKDFYYNDW